MQVIIQFFKDMSPLKIAALAVTAVSLILLFAVFLMKVNNEEYAVLYSDLDLQDSAKVVQELETRKIAYEAAKDGSLIRVHKSEVIKARLELAQVGLPTSGSVVGYEIFDKDDSIGATNFSQNVKLVRALEGELSRTIGAFEEVEKARVHLVMPQREIFSKEKMEPRASVILKFKGNRTLSKSQIDAVSHLVVTAVPSLEMRNITIVDTKGRALKVGSAEDNLEFAGAKNEEVRVAEENRLKKVIEGLLERTLGADKIRATVSLDMNFDRIVTNSELYDPDGAVARSVQTTDEREQTPVGGEGGDVSVANNIPGGAAGGVDPSKFAIVEKSDSTTNYEISKTIKNHITETGAITKMSIGILVDGIYSVVPDTTEKQYAPRSQEDLDKIKNLVKVAVGFDEDRGDKIEVVNMQFSSDFEPEEEEKTDWIKEELPRLFQTLVFAIVVLLVLITVIRPIALKAFDVKKYSEFGEEMQDLYVMGPDGVPVPRADFPSGAPMPAAGTGAAPSANISPVEEGVIQESEEKSVSAINRVNKIATTNPQDLVNVLRKWMNEEG